MINARSLNAADQLTKILTRCGWLASGVLAFPTEQPDKVVLRYNSPAHGGVRRTTCEALALGRWLRDHAATPGALGKFLALLDRKEEYKAARMETPELPLFSQDTTPTHNTKYTHENIAD